MGAPHLGVAAATGGAATVTAVVQAVGNVRAAAPVAVIQLQDGGARRVPRAETVRPAGAGTVGVRADGAVRARARLGVRGAVGVVVDVVELLE